HKYYGYADTTALSNIINYYLQLIFTPHSLITLAIDGHLFQLASDDKPWVGGSGAYNNASFGYVFRNPIAGKDIEKNIGGEVDVTLGVKPSKFAKLEAGYSHFFGGSGVEAVFDGKSDLDFIYVQLVLGFSTKDLPKRLP
ncbi:MAG: alginate export family protein, partial [Candidatus Caldarchaeum sp.]